MTTSQQAERTLKELLGAKLVETDIYTGAGIDENNNKPFRWTKQKVDLVLGLSLIHISEPTRPY